MKRGTDIATSWHFRQRNQTGACGLPLLVAALQAANVGKSNVIVSDIRCAGDFRHVGCRSNLALPSPSLADNGSRGFFSFRGPADALVVPKSNAMLGLRGAGQGVALLAIKASDTAGAASNLKYTKRNQFARCALCQAGAATQVYS
jgi:hypothetical protein